MIRLLSLLLFFATGAVAQDFPRLYHVVDVASDDVLNVRAQPKSGTPILWGMPHDATYVEVQELSPNGKWGKVRGGESGMGWVFMRYMAPVPGGSWQEWPHITCSGSEYPWRFEVSVGGAARYANGYGVEGYALQASPLQSGGEHLFSKGLVAQSDVATVTMSIERAQCSSTMIDADYGLRAAIWAITPDGPRFHNGCCVLSAPPN